jgi:hypothetical protein
METGNGERRGDLMAEYTLSRRTFMAASLSTAAVLGACAITGTPTALHAPTPNPPRAWPGPYQVGEVILGESGGTIAMPNPYTLNQLPVRDLGAADRIGL